MFKIGIVSGLLGVYPKEKVKLAEIKIQADEARNRDLERETGTKSRDSTKKTKNIIKKNPEIKILLENQSVEVNKTIAIEELSELQKEICKDLRGVDRRENIKEEMADVYICLQLLKEIYGFTDEELEEEYKRKMKRNLDRVKV